MGGKNVRVKNNLIKLLHIKFHFIWM